MYEEDAKCWGSPVKFCNRTNSSVESVASTSAIERSSSDEREESPSFGTPAEETPASQSENSAMETGQQMFRILCMPSFVFIYICSNHICSFVIDALYPPYMELVHVRFRLSVVMLLYYVILFAKMLFNQIFFPEEAKGCSEDSLLAVYKSLPSPTRAPALHRLLQETSYQEVIKVFTQYLSERQ